MADETIAGAAAPAPTDAPVAAPSGAAPVSGSPNPVAAAPDPGSAPAPAPAPAGTLADGAPVADKLASVPATWPDDWRVKLAGSDAKAAERLGRFSDPAALWASYRALEQRLSSGEKATKGPPENATPEQMTAWRKEQGIPDDPAGYKPDLPGGVVLGDADKPMVEDYAKYAHDNNMTPAEFNKNLAWYVKMQERVIAEKAEADGAFRNAAEEALRGEWGGNFNANRNAIKNMLAGWPQEARDLLLGGRTADGRLIGDHPAVLKQLAAQAYEINPAATVVPAGGDMSKSIDTELAEIATIRREKPEVYWKDQKMLARERDLIDAQMKLKGRAA